MAWWALKFGGAGSLGITRARGAVIARVMETQIWFLPVCSRAGVGVGGGGSAMGPWPLLQLSPWSHTIQFFSVSPWCLSSESELSPCRSFWEEHLDSISPQSRSATIPLVFTAWGYEYCWASSAHGGVGGGWEWGGAGLAWHGPWPRTFPISGNLQVLEMCRNNVKTQSSPVKVRVSLLKLGQGCKGKVPGARMRAEHKTSRCCLLLPWVQV